MSSKAALVTGANGFLGARLVRRLVERGEQVKALVRAGSDLRQLADLPTSQVRIAVGDVRMCDRVYAALSGCDRLYHVAAAYSVDERDRADIVASAAEGTTATLEAARRASVKKIVVTSSVGTLGAVRSSDQVLSESSEFDLPEVYCYVEAKLAEEARALEAAQAGLPVTIVNPAVMLGPGDYKPTPSGSQIVNYLGFSPSFHMPVPPGGFSYADVDDVADGHIAAMERGRIGERYILGGENLTNRQFIQLLSDVTGLAEPGDDMTRGKANFAALLAELYAGYSGQAPLMTRKLVDTYFGRYVFVSSDKAKKELGYTSRPARESLIRACRWFLDSGLVSKQAARRARLELQPG
jgi:dihydroflavonol-4-reductase